MLDSLFGLLGCVLTPFVCHHCYITCVLGVHLSLLSEMFSCALFRLLRLACLVLQRELRGRPFGIGPAEREQDM